MCPSVYRDHKALNCLSDFDTNINPNLWGQKIKNCSVLSSAYLKSFSSAQCFDSSKEG
jgi:hypothetical protein